MSSADLDQWLKDNGFLLTPFGGYLTDLKQTIRTAKNIDDFKAYLTNTATAYKPVFVYKVNNGINAYRYEESTFKQDGMAFTVIDATGTSEYAEANAALEETAETPGEVIGMGIENLTAWFAQHETTRKFVKGLVIFGIGFAAANEAAILVNLPQWAIVPIGAIITAAANYIQTHTTLPILGAKATGAKTRTKTKL